MASKSKTNGPHQSLRGSRTRAAEIPPACRCGAGRAPLALQPTDGLSPPLRPFPTLDLSIPDFLLLLGADELEPHYGSTLGTTVLERVHLHMALKAVRDCHHRESSRTALRGREIMLSFAGAAHQDRLISRPLDPPHCRSGRWECCRGNRLTPTYMPRQTSGSEGLDGPHRVGLEDSGQARAKNRQYFYRRRIWKTVRRVITPGGPSWR